MSISQLSQGRTLAAAALFMAASAGTSFAQCPADDATTTNNDCANAAPVALGSTTGLSVQGGVEDFWSYSIPSGQTLTVDCLFIDATADLDLNIFVDGTCTSTADTGTSVSDNEQVVFDNISASAVTAVIRVFVWQNPAGSCNDYDLVLTQAPTTSPCFMAVDDAEEENDTCGTAVVPSANPLVGMFVSKADADNYLVSVPAGDQITVDATFIDANGNVNVRIFDATCTTELASGTTFSDNESVTASNLSGAAVNMVIEVSHLASDTAADCNNYDLAWSFAPDPCAAGIDDAEEENDTCATATVASAQALTGLFVSVSDEDFYSISLNPGDSLDVRLDYINNNGDVDGAIIDTADCTTILDTGSFSFSNFEDMFYKNNTGVVQVVAVRVFMDTVSNISIPCNSYDMSYTVTPDPCIGAVDDGEEENDTCGAAVAPSANPLAGLFVELTDEDFYTISVPAGEILTVDLLFTDSIGNVDAQLLDAGCVTVLDSGTTFSDNEQLEWTNASAAAATVTLRVFMNASDASSCNNYDLAWASAPDPCLSTPDDMFEENDDCLSAAPVSAGVQTGLFVLKEGIDEDWYSTDVTPGATITVTCSFINDDGDIDIDLFDACGGTLLQGSAGTADTEDVFWTNGTASTVNVKWAVFVWSGDPTEDCNTYDMDVDIQGGMPTNLIPYCFGDGSGTPCPCGNNSSAGHPGGCANSAGNGAILAATGNPTVGADTLNFDLSSASQNSFALLVSGVNQLPQMGGCIGCGIVAFDGLRCAGGQFLRHGSRATDANGDTGNGWGPPGGPPGGLIAANGFMVGQTRNFFAFYRDDTAQVCQTGQNSSNGIQVTFN